MPSNIVSSSLAFRGQLSVTCVLLGGRESKETQRSVALEYSLSNLSNPFGSDIACHCRALCSAAPPLPRNGLSRSVEANGKLWEHRELVKLLKMSFKIVFDKACLAAT